MRTTFKLACVCVFIIGVCSLLLAAGPSSPNAKAAITGKVALTASYQSLTTLAGRTSPFLFKGNVCVDTGSGASVVVKATISGAADVVATPGSAFPANAINSDTLQFKGAASGDYVNIVGEEVDPLRPNG